MTIPKRIGAVALGLMAVALMDRFPLVAQEPATSKQAAPTAKKRQDPARRVPNYFGQIGLTTEQRNSIYEIQGKRFEKIEALEKQIAAEKAEMIAECEKLLTDVQKKLLDNLRKAATEPAVKSAATSKAAEATKPSN